MHGHALRNRYHARRHRANPATKALKLIPVAIRGHVVAMIGEFVGTLLFLFFAFAGTQVANASSNNNADGRVVTEVVQKNPAQLLYISLSFGFSLAVNAWVFFRISGGLFNPAVTVGMMLIGSLGIIRGILLIVVQILGGIAAAAIVNVLFTGGLNVQTTLGGSTSVAQGTVIEIILTAQLVFTIFMLAAAKHEGNFVAPVGIGLSLFIAELVGVFWTGGSLNPARSLGPDVVLRSFESYHWIYWVGPMVGSVVAALFYNLFLALEYETVNGKNDSADIAVPATDVEKAEVEKNAPSLNTNGVEER